LHTLLTGYFDFALVLTCVLRSRPVPCEHARIATLSFGGRNVQEMSTWLDERLVARLTLLCSDFMEKSCPKEYRAAVAELVEQRGQTVGSARCHAKVCCPSFADGVRLAFEGSANLRTCRNVENLTVTHDDALHVLQDKAKLEGLYPAEKREVAGKDGGPLQLHIVEEIVGREPETPPLQVEEEGVTHGHHGAPAGAQRPPEGLPAPGAAEVPPQ
jgi:hypothetical protein